MISSQTDFNERRHRSMFLSSLKVMMTPVNFIDPIGYLTVNYLILIRCPTEILLMFTPGFNRWSCP
jgi:hypothetical protein